MIYTTRIRLLTTALLVLGGHARSAVAEPGTAPLKFSFAPGKVEPGYTQVSSSNVYSNEAGFGFDPKSNVSAIDHPGPDALHGGYVTSDKPFFFSVKLPEGNYKVTVTLGDTTGESTTTVKAEMRRLCLEHVKTAAGKFETRSFAVNLRTPRITGGDHVKLKEREKVAEAVDWDDRLTLEFGDAHPCLCALELAPAPEATTVYILGDSTVCDQPNEPYASWGQMLPRFFKADVAVSNQAESGESLRSSLGAHRLEKVLSTMKPGDYLFIQYGHNDMKEKGPNVGAFTTYKTDLKHFVDETRKKGGNPVLITSMHRSRLDLNGKIQNSLGDYPEAVRQLAREEKLPLIDLNTMSGPFYEALGPSNIAKAFAPKDGTHHNNYGSYELAKCIVEGIKQNKLGIAKSLVDDVPPFDPSKPDPIDTFDVPPSPGGTTQTPLGS